MEGPVAILLDNQAAIRGLEKCEPGKGQYLNRFFHSALAKLRISYPSLSITLVWIPGHLGITGNETADLEAKNAASNPHTCNPLSLTSPSLPSPLPRSAAAAPANRKKTLRLSWNHEWNCSKYGRRIMSFDSRLPGNQVNKSYKNLPKPHTSVIVQLRSGCIGLNHHLHKIKRVNSPLCTRCNIPETPRHFLLCCLRYINERATLLSKVKDPQELNINNVLANPRNFPYLIEYISQTKRLPNLIK